MTDLPPTEDASAAALPIIDAGSANDDAACKCALPCC